MSTPASRRRTVSESRRGHFLRSSRGVGFPSQQVALVVRSEVDPFTSSHSLRQSSLVGWDAVAWGAAGQADGGCICGSGTAAQGWWEFLARVLRKGRCTWVWQVRAQFGMSLLGFWDKLTLGEWRLDGFDPVSGEPDRDGERQALRGICVIEEPLCIVLARPSHAPGLVRWVDVRNLGVDGWAELSNEQPSALALMAWLLEYQRLVADMDMGGLRHTAGAQAWHGWRNSFMSCPVLVHANNDAIALERSALYSGRAEACRLGKTEGPIFQLDSSSYYPWLATTNPMPARFVRWERADADRLEHLESLGWLCVAKCRIRTEVPILPLRRGDVTVYPVGRWEACYCGPEIELARQHFALESVSELACYEPGDMFSRYMLRLYAEKEAAEQAQRHARRSAVKRLMNSLIGKCAQWGWRWVDYPEYGALEPYRRWYGEHPETGAGCWYRSIAWHTQYSENTGETHDSIPIVAAWVYSLGRVQLWKWLRAAGIHGCLYVDSDGLFVTADGYERLHTAGQIGIDGLGALRLKSVWDWLEVFGVKHYRTPARLTCAGLPQGAIADERDGYTFWLPETVGQTLIEHRAPEAQASRHLAPWHQTYRHGVPGRGGWVQPIRVRELP